MLKEIHAFQWTPWTALCVKWCVSLSQQCLTEACCFGHYCATIFLGLESLRKPITLQFCKHSRLAQACVAPCGYSLACPCANVWAATEELGWSPDLVLINSEKLPLGFSQCHVFDSVLSSAVQVPVPAQGRGQCKWPPVGVLHSVVVHPRLV